MASHFCGLFCKQCGARLHATMEIHENPMFGSLLNVALGCSQCLLHISGQHAFNELQAALLDVDDHRTLEETNRMLQPFPNLDVPPRRPR